MTPYFVHGWGFDASIWSALATVLGGAAIDRGYFGAQREAVPDGPLLAIGHSLGALLLLRDPPPNVRAIVAINGFDRFVADDGWPGTARRVLDRMIARFDAEPAAVLAGFRVRCGAPPPPPIADVARLGADLRLLRDGDARAASARLELPLLVLHGETDPILPPELRERAFGGAPAEHRATCREAAHLLPLSHAAWCAAQIETFAGAFA